jgi:CBS domain-containing protein
MSPRDLMTANLITVRPDHSIFYALSMMDRHNISRLIVKENGMLGIITISDIVGASPLLRPLPKKTRILGSPTATTSSQALETMTVKDLMTTTCDHAKSHGLDRCGNPDAT